ncbi:uncharacterized protein LOC120357485 [Solenopsis invicta]|uniref:uncharacterized protein LOC120357485 n=1 Tax=Solenopsis invicta TaxID=13686 RepID=UPI00193DEB0F|nr:uncharacterized protein LOC120357485 [Solenopsis invicta]
MNVSTVDIEEINVRLKKLDELQRTLSEALIEIAACDKDISDEQIDAEMAICEEKYIELKGEAAETIASIEISDVNYNDAWSRLRERYENERLAVQNHIKAIFELPILRRENGSVLRNILDGLLKHMRALQALKRPTGHWDDLLIHIITSKLDFITIKEWENTLEPRELPTLQDFTEFLSKRCQTLEAVARRTFIGNQNTNLKQNSNVKVIAPHAAVTDVKCEQCKGDHRIYHCKTFKELPITERLNKVKSMKLCLNCLRSKHTIKDCTVSNCRICSKKHSTLLHEDRGPSRENKNETNNQETKKESDSNKASTSVCASALSKQCAKQTLLSTAVVRIKNNEGKYVEGRALLDSGSQSHFITESFAKQLRLKSTEDKFKINGVNRSVSRATKSVNIKLTSRFGTFGTELECIIIQQITPMIPIFECDTVKLNISKNIRLADPNFHVPGQIDILIGSEIFWDLFCIGQIKLGKNMPTLQKSLFGWVVTGPTQINNVKKAIQISCNLSIIDQINETIHKFWEVEAYETNNKTGLDQEEKYCEKFFKETYSRQPGGRFVVKLPVKKEILASLNDSREIALKRFLSLEKRFAKNQEFKNEYVNFMREYLTLGHIKRSLTIKKGHTQVFLPHHAVFKESSTTTKIRVVFDASSKGAKDISKMYRQIFVHKEQTALQSILWREDPTTDIEEYELLTITYGTKPASFLAVRCLHQLAELEKEKFPKAAEVIIRDFYMDDLLTGGNSIEEITELKNQLTELLAKGGFELHKWNTNVINAKEIKSNKNELVKLHKIEESKLLGILWNPSSDAFHYEVESREHEKRATKRAILSQICKLFDPLGLVGPITLAKILMQKLRSLGLDWDESVPISVYKEWQQLKSHLHMLGRLEIPRAILTGDAGTGIQLHGFCDASERAYGACVYVREQIRPDKIKIALICSKSRVAPMKALSLPRLELCGASPSRKWQTFVANRASEIQGISSPSEWHYIKSKENPADLISRGETSEHLINTKLWWEGPPWLQASEETWPIEGEELPLMDAPEMKKQTVIAVTVKQSSVLDYARYSTLDKLIRIVAYVLRFIENTRCKGEKKETILGKVTLQEKRKEELNALSAKGNLSLKSKLKALHPFLDEVLYGSEEGCNKHHYQKKQSILS